MILVAADHGTTPPRACFVARCDDDSRNTLSEQKRRQEQVEDMFFARSPQFPSVTQALFVTN
jgi:hypothetical protein